MEGYSEQARASKRKFDVLTRSFIGGGAKRECCTCGRVTATEDQLYKRWGHGCPMSGGRWRVPLEWRKEWGKFGGDGD